MRRFQKESQVDGEQIDAIQKAKSSGNSALADIAFAVYRCPNSN